MRMHFVVVVFVLALAGCLGACGGSQVAPTTPTGGTSPPVSQSTPPPIPIISFFPIAMNLSPLDVPIWGLRGENSESIVSQMVFCDPEGGAPYNSPNAGFLALT